MALYLGTSGWAYSSWKPRFYPAKLGSKGFLAYYAMRFNSVEVNYTFTSPEKLTRELAARWIAAVPADFRFSFKAPWQVTHSKKRLRPSPVLRDFLKSLRPFVKAEKIGCVLFQLPPTLKCDAELLEKFLARWPGEIPASIEFRHASWLNDEIYSLLRAANFALCIAESDALQIPEVITANHVYCRFRRSKYSKPALADRAAMIAAQLRSGREVYAYQKHEESPVSTHRALAIALSVQELITNKIG